MTHSMSRTVLITGTTSGIGRSLLKLHSRQEGFQIIAVNRRADEALEKAYPQVHFEVIDIKKIDEVQALMKKLVSLGLTPDVFFLNAGINQIDNIGRFNLDTYHDVYDTNYYGVLHFVSAATSLGLKNKTFVALTSTSSIIPNPGHLGYYLSKVNLDLLFRQLAKTDSLNHYKTLNLGPVITNITKSYGGPKGLNKTIFDLLAVSSDKTAAVASRLALSSRSHQRYTLISHLFYWCVSLILKFYPGLYKYEGAKAQEAIESSHQA